MALDWKILAIGIGAGLIVGYLRVSKGGGRTPSTPAAYG